METAGQKGDAAIARTQAAHQTDLFNIGAPGFRIALGDFLKDLGSPSGEPESVRKAFEETRRQINAQYDASGKAVPATIKSQMAASGYKGDVTAGASAAEQTLFTLEQGRQNQLNMAAQQETDTALATRDFDLGQIFGLGGNLVNQSFGFTQNALNANRYNQSNPWGGFLSGAVSGAGMGATFGGVGAPVGAIAGGLLGYFSGRG